MPHARQPAARAAVGVRDARGWKLAAGEWESKGRWQKRLWLNRCRPVQSGLRQNLNPDSVTSVEQTEQLLAEAEAEAYAQLQVEETEHVTMHCMSRPKKNASREQGSS